MIPGAEDIDLARRIALRSDMAMIPAIVACIGMGTEASSTDYSRAVDYGRWAREKILSASGVFARMRTSANSGYWRGRIVRAYLTSAVWNVQRKNVFTAASRVTLGFASFVLAGRHILSRRFWRAVTRSHDSETFLRGFQAANRLVERREYRDLQAAK